MFVFYIAIYLLIAGAGSRMMRGSHSITRGDGERLPLALCLSILSAGETAA